MDSVGHISFAADQQGDLGGGTRFTKASCLLQKAQHPPPRISRESRQVRKCVESVLSRLSASSDPVYDHLGLPAASLGFSASDRWGKESIRGLHEFVTPRSMGPHFCSDNREEGAAVLA